MRWFGLDAGSLALALLFVSALLLALYLRGRPTTRQMVSSLALWAELDDTAGARRRIRLRAPLSLLLALLIACCLLFALADPRPAYEPCDHLLWIDRGLAMSARDVGETRLSVAKRAVHVQIDALRPGERAQIASFADHPIVHTELSDDRALLHAAVDRLEASLAPSAPDAAARLNRALRAALRHPRTQLFGSRDSFPTDTFVRVGTSERNVGITQLTVRSYPLDRAHASCLVTVENFGHHSETVRLRVRADVLLHEQTFPLAAGARVTRVLDDLAGRALALEASIALAAGPDALPEDDRATTTSLVRAPRVRLFSAGNRYLEAALLVDPELVLTDGDEYDVAIFDRTLPASAPTQPALYLGPPPEGGSLPLVRTGEVKRPFFERVDATSWLAGLSLRDVNIARATATVPEHNDHVVAMSSDGTPLLVEGQRRAPFVVLTFALPESDLALRAAFPVLLLRALDRLAGRPSRETSETHAGPIAPHGESSPRSPRQLSEWWPWLALLGWALLALEALAFRRGWTS